MNLHGLRNRLSALQDRVPRFQELADALDEFWSVAENATTTPPVAYDPVTQFQDGLNRLESLRSIFTADEAGLHVIARELGWYFEAAPIDKANRAMQILLRKWELLHKQTTIPLKMTLQRIGVTTSGATLAEWRQKYAIAQDRLEYNEWQRWPADPLQLLPNDYLLPNGTVDPQYALLHQWRIMDWSQTYFDHVTDAVNGTNGLVSLFGSGPNYTTNINDYMTPVSRITVYVNPAIRSLSPTLDEIEKRVRAVKPLHIALDGVVYYDSLVPGYNSSWPPPGWPQ